MTDPITYRHGDHWSTDVACSENACEGYQRAVTGSLRVEVDGENVKVGEWVFYPPEDTPAEVEKALAAWTAYRDYLRRLRWVEFAITNTELEGGNVSDATQSDMVEYAEGRIDAAELRRRTLERYQQ